MSDLKPRYQICNNKIFLYDDYKEAKLQADDCNDEPVKDLNYKWKYVVEEYKGEI